MSKIEDALNKAKAARSHSLVRAPDSEHRKQDNVKQLIPSFADDRQVGRQSSSKEISLIDNGEILESKELSELKIIYSDMSDNKIANTYRDLRTKLIQKSQGKNFIAMITSCVPGNDSGMTSLNIATAFSFDESKTSLLIDCNLNNPKLDSLLKMEADKGLTDYLDNESIKIETIMHKTGIKRLKMIPAGTARETAIEYFTSMRMRDLMSSLLSRYSDRYIFLDTAPITESADTKILAELCDFMILVVPYGTTTKKKLKETIDSIGSNKLIGVVFNNTPKLPTKLISKIFNS